MNLLEKKEQLKKVFHSKPKKDKLITAKDLDLKILPETFKWFKENRW